MRSVRESSLEKSEGDCCRELDRVGLGECWEDSQRGGNPTLSHIYTLTHSVHASHTCLLNHSITLGSSLLPSHTHTTKPPQQAIGFDMDYTLAQYKPDTFELLAHRQTIDKLVTAFGYPPELYDFQFDHRYMMRGLIIDKVRLGFKG